MPSDAHENAAHRSAISLNGQPVSELTIMVIGRLFGRFRSTIEMRHACVVGAAGSIWVAALDDVALSLLPQSGCLVKSHYFETNPDRWGDTLDRSAPRVEIAANIQISGQLRDGGIANVKKHADPKPAWQLSDTSASHAKIAGDMQVVRQCREIGPACEQDTSGHFAAVGQKQSTVATHLL